MRDTDWTPSIVPGDEDRDVCLVVNDFGRRGRAWCEQVIFSMAIFASHAGELCPPEGLVN
jgi:hypothetical protein